MHTLIEYNGDKDRAIQDAKDYLGDRYDLLISSLLAHAKDKREIRVWFAFAGVEGYPVECIIEKYFKELPDETN